MPFRLFTRERLASGDVNTYLMGQVVSRFTSAAQRLQQLGAPVLNQLSQRQDASGALERWDGDSWEWLAGGTSPTYPLDPAPGWSENTQCPMHVWKDAAGAVHLGGIAVPSQSFASRAWMATLPAGFRPDVLVQLVVPIGAGIVTIYEVQPDGGLYAVPGGTIPSGTTHHLGLVTFHPRNNV